MEKVREAQALSNAYTTQNYILNIGIAFLVWTDKLFINEFDYHKH